MLFLEQILLPYKMLCPWAQSAHPYPTKTPNLLPKNSKCLRARTWHLWIRFPLAWGSEFRSSSHSEEPMAGDILCAHYMYRSGCTFGRRWLELTFVVSHMLSQMLCCPGSISPLLPLLATSMSCSSLEVETTGVKDGFCPCRQPTAQNTASA